MLAIPGARQVMAKTLGEIEGKKCYTVVV